MVQQNNRFQSDANADEKPEQSPYQFGTWYPIETAPKDGAKILATDGDIHLIVGWDGFAWLSWEWSGCGDAFPDRSGIYWMPLPPAPSPGDKP